MPQHRRHFLQHLALAAAALSSGRLLAAPKASSAKNSGTGYATFAANVGRDFSARASASMTTLKLTDVVRPKTLKGYPDVAKSREQSFTLIFRVEEGTKLPEGIYTLSAIGVAPFEAFVSPIYGNQRDYQVVFNRI
jgi:hypothetical protein